MTSLTPKKAEKYVGSETIMRFWNSDEPDFFVIAKLREIKVSENGLIWFYSDSDICEFAGNEYPFDNCIVCEETFLTEDQMRILNSFEKINNRVKTMHPDDFFALIDGYKIWADKLRNSKDIDPTHAGCDLQRMKGIVAQLISRDKYFDCAENAIKEKGE